jgi:hypothetical protein
MDVYSPEAQQGLQKQIAIRNRFEEARKESKRDEGIWAPQSAKALAVYRMILDEIELSAITGRNIDINGLWKRT